MKIELEPVRLLSIIPANASGRCCGLRDLADDWGISEQDMFSMLKALSDAGFIETDQPEFCEESSICFRSMRGDELVYSLCQRNFPKFNEYVSQTTFLRHRTYCSRL